MTFTHLYSSPDSLGEAGARQNAQKLASSFNRQGLGDAVGGGDPFPGAYNFSASHEELARVFGREGLAETIFDVEPVRWSAPLRSGFGWHTVYVSVRQPARQIPFNEAREAVRRDYLDAERDRRNAEAFAKLRERFQIRRE